jgi:outer membrane receptor protein involved in Fe transport
MTTNKSCGYPIRRLLISTFLILAMFSAAPVKAQVTGATLSGTVTDQSGAAIPNAQVSIKNTATGVARNVTTNDDGIYTAPNLLPGSYEVTVSSSGLATQIRTGITLTVGAAQSLDFKMHVGAVAERAEVTEEAPVVELQSSEISSVVNSTTVRELPLNGRSWTDLAILQPGVSRIESAFIAAAGADRGERGFGTQLSISGGKPVQNNYRLDGVSVNDFANGAPGNVAGSSLGVDAIQEFSVITSNYSAEYGRTSGGVINAITRSGTNEFHGSAFEFIRNSALDARNPFDVDPVTNKPIRSPFRRNQFGGSAGGPIKKDRLFIFGDYEGIRQSKGIANLILVPTDAVRATVSPDSPVGKYLNFWPHAPAGAIQPTPFTAQFGVTGQQILNENFVTSRADYKLSDRDSIFGTYLYDNTNFSTPDALNQVLNGHHINRQAVIVEETHMFSPVLVNSFRFGYNQVNAFDNNGITAIDPLAADSTLASVPGRNAARIDILSGEINNFGGGLGTLDHFLNAWKSFQAYDDAFFTHNTHSIKFGVAVERMHNNITAFADAAGHWQFRNLSEFLANTPAGYASALTSPTPRNMRQTIFGAYVQDDWRFRSNLTLNLGLRYEMATVLSEANGKFANLRNITDALPSCEVANPGCSSTGQLYSNPTLRNFEPRIGLSWDPFRDGKTAVRAGFGMFDVLPLPYIVTLLEIRPAPFNILGSTTTVPPNSFFTGGQALLGSNSLSSTFIESHPHRNYVMQWNLNVQRQVSPNVAFLVSYVGSRGVHQQFRVDDADMRLPTLTSQGWLFPLATACGATPTNPDPCKLNSAFGAIRSLWWNGNSSYHSLEVSATKRMSHGLQLQGSFTWGKSIDNNSAGVGADSFQNSLSSLHWYDLRMTRAVSDYNISRTLSISTTWEVPGFRNSSGPAHWVLGGWELGSIFTAHDGMPVTPLIGDPGFQQSSDPFAFPDRVNSPNCSSLVNPGNVQNYIKTECFALPQATAAIAAQCQTFGFRAPGTNGPGDPGSPGIPGTCANLRGNAGRNIIVGPGFLDFDFSLFKNMPVKRISEKFNIQFRAEFFNVINRPNYQAPADTNVLFNPDGTANNTGTLAHIVGDQRDIQFALKFIW